MMEDAYSEYSVARKRAKWVIPAWVGFFVCLAGVIYFILCMNWIFTVLLAIVGAVLLFLLLRYRSVEYEYIYVLDELTVDKIYRKSFRKSGIRVTMQDVEQLCPTEDSDAERLKGMGSQVSYEDYTSHEPGRPSYALKYLQGGRTHFLFFEPNEKMLKQMRHDHPGKVKLRK